MAALLSSAFAVTTAAAPASAAPGPFVCAPGFFQVISGQLNLLQPQTGTYTPIGPVQSFYNALGYNTADDFLYAMGSDVANKGHLLRISNDGSIQDLGVPTGLPAASYVAGDFDNAGHLIIRSTATTWYSITVASTPPVATTLIITGASDTGNDLVWINGNAYLANGSTLYTVNLTTHVATSATVTGIGSLGAFGAAWSDNPNELFFSDNNTGHIFLITGFTTATPSGVLLVTGIITSNNDGAACKVAANPFEVPVANPDGYTATADTVLNHAASGGVLGNDIGAGITVTANTSTSHGTVTVNADGSFTYTPSPGYSGLDSFGYTITDAFSRTSTATVSLRVDPVAADVTGSGTAPAAILVTPAAPVGVGPFTYALASTPPPADGAATINSSTGEITFTPALGFTGPVPTFTYTVTDAASGVSAPATINLTVNPPGGPVAANDTYTTTADTAINQGTSGGLLTNDSGIGIIVASYSTPGNGSVSVNPDGSFLYTPTAGYSGADSFTYTISDAFSNTSTATVSLTVSPVAADVSGSGTGPAPITVTPSSPIGVGPFTYTLVSTPPGSDGIASMNPVTGAITFTPAAGFVGAVPTFTYTVTDASSDVSAPANIDLTVNAPAAPAALDDTYATLAESAINQGASGGLLTNDTGTGITVTSNTSPAHGTVTVNPDGSFLYAPAANYSGPDSFDYTITDAYARTSTATARFTVDPVAFNVIGTGPGPGAIVVTPPAPLGTGPLTYGLVTTPPGADGTATMDPATGQITFIPAAGFTGVVPTFTYTVTDASSDVSAPADVDLTVGTPAPPLAQAVSGTTPAGHALTLTPAAPSGVGPFTYALASTPPAADGVATIDPTTGAITFTPAPGFSGIVPPFTYTVTDSFGQTSLPADISIAVTPLAEPASGKGPAGKPITVQPPAPVGTGPFTYVLVPGSLPPTAEGTVTIDPATGAITFTPAAGFAGTISVEYTVTDGDGLTSPPSTVSFDVAAIGTTVPSTGAVETPLIGGVVLFVMGLLLIAGGVAGRLVRRRGRVLA